MGMNYYHRINQCTLCGRYDEMHIGKSSFGWTFAFRGYLNGPAVIRSYQDWLTILEAVEAVGDIYNEEGNEISVEEFKAMVESKRVAKHNQAIDHPSPHDWLDPEGYSFCDLEFS